MFNVFLGFNDTDFYTFEFLIISYFSICYIALFITVARVSLRR